MEHSAFNAAIRVNALADLGDEGRLIIGQEFVAARKHHHTMQVRVEGPVLWKEVTGDAPIRLLVLISAPIENIIVPAKDLSGDSLGRI